MFVGFTWQCLQELGYMWVYCALCILYCEQRESCPSVCVCTNNNIDDYKHQFTCKYIQNAVPTTVGVVCGGFTWQGAPWVMVL